MPPTHYAVLGVSSTATLLEIKEKYRDAARKYHPDVAADADKLEAMRRFVQINRAYRVLRDAEQRRRYDQSLRPGGAPPPSVLASPETVDIPLTLRQAEHAFFQGQLPQARALCAKILKQDGRHAAALALLGDVLFGLNKPEEAAVAFRLSLQSAPNAQLQAKLARLMQARAAALSPVPPRAPGPPPPSAGNAEEPKRAGVFIRLFQRT